jgi:L-seryl-tRNA(Ser) seleniumtransferase
MTKNNQADFTLLPSVQQVLDELSDITSSIKLVYLTILVREEVERFRKQLIAGKLRAKDRAQVIVMIRDSVLLNVRQLIDTPLKRLVNATGIILHTGLGRAPLGEWPIQYLMNMASGYLNLEFDLESGKRGERLDLTDQYLRLLTGAEYSAVVNNNAAAVLITLNTLANRREVIISRGELIEIGGSFRLPEVMQKSGARLVEVGTTNRTYLKDYEAAINAKTGAILVANTSNYRVKGFTSKPQPQEIVALGQQHEIPIIHDLGSGAIVSLPALGLPDEPLVSESVRNGFDVITFSGDKLLGAVQAGIIVGKADYIARIRRNSLMRVVRCDKITLALLVATFRHYLLNAEIPEVTTYNYLTRTRQELHAMTRVILEQVPRDYQNLLGIEVCDTLTEAGSGSLPTEVLPSVAIRLHSSVISEEQLAQLFRQQDPPVVGYLKEDYFYLDLKAVSQKELVFIQNAINQVAGKLLSQ